MNWKGKLFNANQDEFHLDKEREGVRLGRFSFNGCWRSLCQILWHLFVNLCVSPPFYREKLIWNASKHWKNIKVVIFLQRSPIKLRLQVSPLLNTKLTMNIFLIWTCCVHSQTFFLLLLCFTLFIFKSSLMLRQTTGSFTKTPSSTMEISVCPPPPTNSQQYCCFLPIVLILPEVNQV